MCEQPLEYEQVRLNQLYHQAIPSLTINTTINFSVFEDGDVQLSFSETCVSELHNLKNANFNYLLSQLLPDLVAYRKHRNQRFYTQGKITITPDSVSLSWFKS